MPHLALAPILTEAIPAAIGAGATIFGAKKVSDANKKATDISAKGAAEALAYQKQKDAQDQANYDKQQAGLKAQWDAEQARRAPFRAAAEALLRNRGQDLSLGDLPSSAPPAMPTGWTPGAAMTPATPQKPTLSSLAGLSSNLTPPPAAPVSLSDVLNGTWNQRF